jgi:hypothetical protein
VRKSFHCWEVLAVSTCAVGFVQLLLVFSLVCLAGSWLGEVTVALFAYLLLVFMFGIAKWSQVLPWSCT